MHNNTAMEQRKTPLSTGHAGACGKAATGDVQCLTSVDQIRQFSEQIEDLAARAFSPNILNEPGFLCAAWEHLFANDPKARILLVWDQMQGPNPSLIGLLPLAIDSKLWGGVPLGVCFRSNMKFAGVPLLDKNRSALALDRILASIPEVMPFPAAVLFDEVPADGEFAGAFLAAFARAGWGVRSYEGYTRVTMDATRPGEEYLAEAVSSKKRKEYRRLTNRLKDMGELAFEIVREPEHVCSAFEELLQLEKSGWKGANQTAILDREDWSNFFRHGTAGAVRSGQVEIARLSLNGDAIAAGLVLTSGDTAWFYKIAYREDLAQYSPGVLLTLDLTKYFCERPDIRIGDSCACDDHPMITHLWRERCQFHDLLAVPPGSPASIIFCAETMRREARTLLKKGYHTIKRKLRG